MRCILEGKFRNFFQIFGQDTTVFLSSAIYYETPCRQGIIIIYVSIIFPVNVYKEPLYKRKNTSTSPGLMSADLNQVSNQFKINFLEYNYIVKLKLAFNAFIDSSRWQAWFNKSKQPICVYFETVLTLTNSMKLRSYYYYYLYSTFEKHLHHFCGV